MARKGRRARRKLEPPLPEAPDELVLPKYFKMIRGGGLKGGERREVLPGPMPDTRRFPKAITGGPPRIAETPFPGPAPEPERVPLIIRVARHFVSLFTVEPERPEKMPTVPELNYPALYTRYPVMKTVTKATDVNGEIIVDYSHRFMTIPGVVITVKDPDNVFGTVFNTTLTQFKVRLFKMDHDHGGVVDDNGAHTPTINADGNHSHNVQGTGSLSLDTKYGRLVLANYTDYESAHTHTNPNTGYESSHTHSNPSTDSDGSHGHSAPSCSGATSKIAAATGVTWGTACTLGSCIQQLTTHYVSLNGHNHTIGSIASAGSHTHTVGDSGSGASHRHSQANTGAGSQHRHLMSNDTLYDHYVYNVGLTLNLVASAQESPYHAHSASNIAAHAHNVPEDGRVLLKSTNVTITYIAQEESA